MNTFDFAVPTSLRISLDECPDVVALRDLVGRLGESRFTEQAKQIHEEAVSSHMPALAARMAEGLKSLPIPTNLASLRGLIEHAQKGETSGQLASLGRDDKRVAVSALYWGASAEVRGRPGDKVSQRAIGKLFGVVPTAVRDLTLPLEFERACDRCGAPARAQLPYMTRVTIGTIRCPKCAHVDFFHHNRGVLNSPKMTCTCAACASEVRDVVHEMQSRLARLRADIPSWLCSKVAACAVDDFEPSAPYDMSEDDVLAGFNKLTSALSAGMRLDDSVDKLGYAYFEWGITTSWEPSWVARLQRFRIATVKVTSSDRSLDAARRSLSEAVFHKRYNSPDKVHSDWWGLLLRGIESGDIQTVAETLGIADTREQYHGLPQVLLPIAYVARATPAFAAHAARLNSLPPGSPHTGRPLEGTLRADIDAPKPELGQDPGRAALDGGIDADVTPPPGYLLVDVIEAGAQVVPMLIDGTAVALARPTSHPAHGGITEVRLRHDVVDGEASSYILAMSFADFVEELRDAMDS